MDSDMKWWDDMSLENRNNHSILVLEYYVRTVWEHHCTLYKYRVGLSTRTA